MRIAFTVLFAVSCLTAATSAQSFVTKCLSLTPGGALGGGASTYCDVSGSGRYVAFQSDAPNLVANDTNNFTDIFVRDVWQGVTTIVSVDSAGGQGNGISTTPSISRDGRYVSFVSLADNLVANDSNAVHDVFVHDRQLGTTWRASVDSQGAEGDKSSYGQSLARDGKWVTFVSLATNLVPGDLNGFSDVFVHELATGITLRASLDGSGNEGNGGCGGNLVNPDRAPSVSDNGQFVVFQSTSNNLVTPDTNADWDVFLKDMTTGAIELISVSTAGVQGSSSSYDAVVSIDGRYVAFESFSQLDLGDTNLLFDIYLRDRQMGTTVRLNLTPTGQQSLEEATDPAITEDGRFVAFHSRASDLVIGDTNNKWDVFACEVATGIITKWSTGTAGNQSNDNSWNPAIIASGLGVAFMSQSTNLHQPHTNSVEDVFLRIVQFPAPTAYCTAKVNSCGGTPVISATGVSSSSEPVPFSVEGTGARMAKFGLLIYTDQGRRIPAVPFGQGGLLCLLAPIRRTIPVAASNGTPGACDATFSIDMNAFAAGLLGGNPQAYLSVPATVVDCQLWGRDTLTHGSYLTDALEYRVGL